MVTHTKIICGPDDPIYQNPSWTIYTPKGRRPNAAAEQAATPTGQSQQEQSQEADQGQDTEVNPEDTQAEAEAEAEAE